MSFPHTVLPIQLGVPIKGYNAKDPFAAMGVEYAAWAMNWEPEAQYLRVRNGHIFHCTISPTVITYALQSYGTKLFAYVDTPVTTPVIYDVTSGTASAETTPGIAGTDPVPIRFARYAGFMTSGTTANGSWLYNGTSWSAMGFTYGGSPIAGEALIQYKGRVYIFYNGDMYYSTLGATTGAMTQILLGSVFEYAGNIIWAKVLSGSSGASVEQYLAFGNTEGETLVYGGDNPGATNWELVGRLKHAAPINKNAAIDYSNDILIATKAGLLSLRRMLAYDESDLEKVSLSSKIDPYWSDVNRVVGGYTSNLVSLAYHSTTNKIYVLFDYNYDAGGGLYTQEPILFVYNGYSNAWTIQKLDANTNVASSLIYQPTGIIEFNKIIYYARGGKVIKIGTGYKDSDVNTTSDFTSYSFSLHSAYTPLNSANKHKDLIGVEPVIKTDFSSASNITIKAAADFGKEVSAAKSVALQDGYQSPLYTVGARGNYLQYRIEGTTDTASADGLELYSVGLVVK